jgi:hypothetical protein
MAVYTCCKCGIDTTVEVEAAFRERESTQKLLLGAVITEGEGTEPDEVIVTCDKGHTCTYVRSADPGRSSG